MADPNTRQGKRTPVTLKIKFKSETLEQFIERYAVDVSQGGIFIRTKEPLAVGTQMRFEFQLRDASPLIAGEGTVVWTRENDPSRPAIAPGMGVRFDRLAEGSQTILERILSEKAKQAPQRPANESTKPPLFTDTPTRVAPMPVQEALMGEKKRPSADGFGTEHTPLPKPMPFHSDAEDFDEQAFEEATKVRALDELIAQTADGDVGGNTAIIPPDELAARRIAAGARADSTVADPPALGGAPAGTGPIGVAKVTPDERESAPGLPSPPAAGPAPRMLDASPSPRVETPPADIAKTKLGFDAPRNTPAPSTPPASKTATPKPTPTPVPAVKDQPARPSGMQAVATEPTSRSKRPTAPTHKSSAVPVLILILVLVAAAGAGVWFFYLRPKAEEAAKKDQPPPTPGTGTAVAGNPPTPDAQNVTPSPAVDAAPEAPPGPLVDTVIAVKAGKATATIEIVGTDQKGPAPLTAKLEKDKAYKARISAPGFATLEVDVKGGQEKMTAKLDPKPRVISVTTDPPGALIFVDGAATGHTTPHAVELTKAQAAKTRVKITMRKSGFRPVDKLVAADAYKETDARMEAALEEKLAVQTQVVRPPPPDRGSAGGTGAGTGSEPTPPDQGSGTGAGTASPPPPATPTPPPTSPAGTGSAAKPPAPTPTPPAGGSAAKPPAPTPTPPAGGSAAKPPAPTPTPPAGGSAAKTGEPEPDFLKK